jgi:hypothetical protein
MSNTDLTTILEQLTKIKDGLADLNYELYSQARELDNVALDKAPAPIVEVLDHAALDADKLCDELTRAIAAAASISAEMVPGLPVETSGYTFTGYNLHMGGAAHSVAALVSGLQAQMLKSRGWCSCDSTGTCAAHAGAFNELRAAEAHLTKAARAFIEARP